MAGHSCAVRLASPPGAVPPRCCLWLPWARALSPRPGNTATGRKNWNYLERTGHRAGTFSVSLLKGGIPAAPSGTATLLRLSPSHRFYPKQLLKRSPSSGTPGFHGLTGGVYKVRERIHRAMADARLLAIPTSWSRVADSNPNWDGLSWIGSTSRLCDPLYPPL